MTTIGQHRRHTGPSNRGEATLLAGATTVTITHGLVYQPRIILCNPALDIGDFFVTNIEKATFRFNCDTAPGANCAIYWFVE